MTSVPLEELRHHLDDYLKRSRSGEHILITDQGREIAELTPAGSSRLAIAALRDAGKVAWSGGKPKGLRDLEVKGEPVSETVLEDRR